GNGQVDASYWLPKRDLHGRLYNNGWQAEEQISTTTTTSDTNAWLFSSGTNVYAIYYDNSTESLNLSSRTSTGTWTINRIGTGESHTGTLAFSPSYFSLPDTASFDSTNNRLYWHCPSHSPRTEPLHRHGKPLNHNIPHHRIDRQLRAHKPTRRLRDIQLHAQQLDSRKLYRDSHGYERSPQPPNHHNRLGATTATTPRLYHLSLIARTDQRRPIRPVDDNRNSTQWILRNHIPHRYDTLRFDLRIN